MSTLKKFSKFKMKNLADVKAGNPTSFTCEKTVGNLTLVQTVKDASFLHDHGWHCIVNYE